MGIDSLKNPSDFFTDGENFYIADTGNNRIIVTDKSLKSVINIYEKLKMPDNSFTELSYPSGIFADENFIYIADTGNERIILINRNGEIAREIKKPRSEIYDSEKIFMPEKIIADKAGNIYSVLSNITSGCAVFTSNGDFSGFFGADSIKPTAEIVLNYFRNFFMSDEKKSRRKRVIPSGIDNFDINGDFIFTCNLSEKSAEKIKKINSAEKNIFAGREMKFGDLKPEKKSSNYKIPDTKICDIDISENGFINCIDSESGHIFQYDSDGNLLFIMGEISEKSGGFTAPTAIETLDGNIYILDSHKNNITVFELNYFGKIVHEAVNMYNSGFYEESVNLWNEIIMRDGNYTYAYTGLAFGFLRKGEYDKSMKYAEISGNSDIYNKAFKEYRRVFLKENSGLIIFILFFITVFFSVLKKIKIENLTQIKWLIYSVMHPVNSFEDMRWKKAGSLKISSCLILLFFIAEIAENRFFGMQFFINDERNFTIIPYFIKSIILFFVWTLGNWLVSIFLDGEGIFKDIFIYSSYALFPYISQIFINIFLSHILVQDEYVFMQIIEFIGTLWTLFLLFSAVKSVHQYTVKRTFLAVFLTIVSMFSILVILIIFILLLRQVFIFFSTIYMEIFYRVKIS